MANVLPHRHLKVRRMRPITRDRKRSSARRERDLLRQRQRAAKVATRVASKEY